LCIVFGSCLYIGSCLRSYSCFAPAEAALSSSRDWTESTANRPLLDTSSPQDGGRRRFQDLRTLGTKGWSSESSPTVRKQAKDIGPQHEDHFSVKPWCCLARFRLAVWAYV